MFRIVIADDDEILLEGLTCAFDWAELGIEVAASVVDGDKALAAVKETEADLLLTDIRMANMDGLLLTTKLQQEEIDVSIIIMSAYDEFQYAQQALRLNVEDYLLKPLDLEQLKTTVCRVIRKRSEARKKHEELKKIIKEHKESREESIFKRLVKGYLSPGELKSFQEEYAGSGTAWQLLEVCLDETRLAEEKQRMIRQTAGDFQGKLLEWSGEKALYCFQGQREELAELILRFKSACREKIREEMQGDTLSFMNGPQTQELSKLGLAYETVQQIEAYRYTEGKEADLSEQDIEKYYNLNHALNKSLIAYTARLAFLGEKQAVSDYVGRLKTNLKHVGNNSKIMLSFALSLFWGEFNKNGIKPEAYPDKIQEKYNDYYKEIMAKGTLDEAMVCFEQMVLEFARELSEKEYDTNVSNEELIRRAKGMIERQFSDPGLRLADVAATVGLSPNYFSTVFKEITGQGFADYLTERRMKEAQHLLMTTRYRSGEIAARVGYDNSTYFSSTFKKYSGMTVSRYREMIRP